jgi:hypothetical protein
MQFGRGWSHSSRSCAMHSSPHARGVHPCKRGVSVCYRAGNDFADFRKDRRNFIAAACGCAVNEVAAIGYRRSHLAVGTGVFIRGAGIVRAAEPEIPRVHTSDLIASIGWPTGSRSCGRPVPESIVPCVIATITHIENCQPESIRVTEILHHLRRLPTSWWLR